MRSFQERADEAFELLLKRHGRPVLLQDALKASVRSLGVNDNAPDPGKPTKPKKRAKRFDAEEHFNEHGWKEGSDPSAFFDTSFYLALNPAVRTAGTNPLTQFDQSDWKSGAVPSLNFDAAAYLAAYPDVKVAGVDPLRHFLQNGAQKGHKSFTVDELMASNGFDYAYEAQSLDALAANLGVSRETVRGPLKAVLAKTGPQSRTRTSGARHARRRPAELQSAIIQKDLSQSVSTIEQAAHDLQSGSMKW